MLRKLCGVMLACSLILPEALLAQQAATRTVAANQPATATPQQRLRAGGAGSRECQATVSDAAAFLRARDQAAAPLAPHIQRGSRVYGRHRRHFDGHWSDCRGRRGFGYRRHRGRMGCLRRPSRLALGEVTNIGEEIDRPMGVSGLERRTPNCYDGQGAA